MFLEFFRWMADLLEDKPKKQEVLEINNIEVALWRCDTLQWETGHLYERYRDNDNEHVILLGLSLLHSYYKELSNFYLYKKLHNGLPDSEWKNIWKTIMRESYNQAMRQKSRLLDVKYALDREGIHCNFDVENLAHEVMGNDE